MTEVLLKIKLFKQLITILGRFVHFCFGLFLDLRMCHFEHRVRRFGHPKPPNRGRFGLII